MVKQNNDIEQVMHFLEECKFIKIEDILPFFPNFITIDHFKDAVCSSLEVRMPELLRFSFLWHTFCVLGIQQRHKQSQGRNGGCHQFC